MPADSGVLTVEYKVNFTAPARGAKFLAIGRVIKPGRTLTVCAREVLATDGAEQKLVAMIQATMMRLREAQPERTTTR
jgi:acyl-coenzyme A thioesterase PaaI-like protein